jgi:hypothetical protein
VTLTSAADGQGDGTITYRVSENGDPVQRQATLTVAERTVAVAQTGAACRFELNGIPSAVASDGGDASLELATHAACAWTARSEREWAEVSPAAGTGPAVLRVRVAANTGDSRPIEITVGGVRASFQQAAANTPVPGPTPTPTPGPGPGPGPGGPGPGPGPEGPGPTNPIPTPVRAIELEGKVEAVSGSCPALTFRLEGHIVYTTSDTRWSEGSCKNLKNKKKVELRGQLMSDQRVRADRVIFDD